MGVPVPLSSPTFSHSNSMKAGDSVALTHGNVRRRGRLLLVSGNEDSLMVELEDGFPTEAGLCINFLPLLRTYGVYRDLINGQVIDIAIVTNLPGGG